MAPAVSFTLANGLKVIVSEDHTTPVAAMSVWVRAGVCEEPNGQRGIAHFVEHMLFRGSRRFHGKEHSNRIERMGGQLNAFTHWDMTVYHQTVPADRISEIFELEGDRILYPLFRKDDTDVERKVILEEFEAQVNDPDARAYRCLIEELGEGHPYCLTPLGRRPHVESITHEQLAQFHREYYTPNNSFIVVCGAVRTEEIAVLARRHFGDWQAAKTPPRERPLYRPKLGNLRLNLSFRVPMAVRAFALKPMKNEDEPALHLLMSLLVKGGSAPMREDLLRRRRLCVHVDGELHHMDRGGMLALFGAFLPPTRFKTVRSAIKEHCDRLADAGPNPADFPQHLKLFQKLRLREAYTPAGRMMGHGNAEALRNGFQEYEQMLQKYAEVTPERVRAQARALFAPSNTLELDIHPEHIKRWMWLAGLFMKVWRR